MKIILIGHGRVGTHLHTTLRYSGHEVTWMHGSDLKEVGTCDIILIAVTDTALPAVAQKIAGMAGNAVVAHTAGSIGFEVFDHTSHDIRCGVFYPMQTFSIEREVDFRHVPLFVEANCDEARQTLEKLAMSVSDSVHHLTSEQRRRLHVAAVFACNFVNHCVTLADRELQRIGLDYHTMLPLLDETVAKLHTLSPMQAQTGPAARSDKAVVEEHERMIDDKRTKEIYRLMSESISAS